MAKSQPKPRETQSFRLYKLFTKARSGVSRDQIATALNLKPVYVGSYLAELKRVYGAKLEYDSERGRYVLKNKIVVPQSGLAGKAPNLRKQMKVQLREGSRRRAPTKRVRAARKQETVQVTAPSA